MSKHIGICAAGAATIAALTICGAVRADCLDELMPRPREVMRGIGGCLKAPVGPGAYQLVVRDGKPLMQGDEEGRRYALATFRQLKKLAEADGAEIPDCTIYDWPEFRYRGLMLDCGRNYQSVESIKDVISMLAAYKMNVFHWHLTDNYGWRLESKRHPELQKKDAFSRNVGKFYTQQEFKDVLAFAKKRGVTVIPELDMPGHTLAFRKATGIDDLADEKAKVVLGELIDELCSLAPVEDMPIVHLGTDEARERGEKVPQGHLDYWAKKVTDNGRTLMGWSPGLRLPGQSIKQLWMGARDPRGDKTPYIDSQNSYYINHVDPEELLSVAAYQQPCRWGEKDEKLGAIIGVWHDDAIADTEDVVRMNAVYPAIVLLSDNFWRGREKDEPTLYARLPKPDDPRFALAADLERRALAQRDKVLKGLRHPFPYVAQTHMRWRMTDENGAVLAEDIPQATVYPRHFWFPQGAYAPGNGGVVTLETWIRSEREIDCGAWIGMTGFSRSDGRSRDAPTPKLGEWNKHGATVELNGRKIEPPKWTHPGVGGNPKETPLVDEDYWYRPPTRIHLKRGVNHVRMTLPKKGGWKWIGTFTPMLGTSDHPSEVSGLSYSSRPLQAGAYRVAISESANADPAWRAVADALAAKHAASHGASVVVANPSDARAALRTDDPTLAPRYVAFVMKPEEADAKTVSALHAAMKSLDDDPYYDAVWGIVTGPTADAAMRLAMAGAVHPRSALTTTGVDFRPYDDATTLSDGYAPGSKREEYGGPNPPVAIFEKRGGSERTPRIVRGDTTAEFAAAWDALDPELLVTSSHASQGNLEMPFSTGNIVSRGGELWTLPNERLIDYATGQAQSDAAQRTASARLAAPKRDKIWIAAGNCLIGDYKDNGSMAAALIGYGRVVQFMGYVKTTWFGEIGWETLAQFAERGATAAEAWYFAGQDLERKLLRTPADGANYKGRIWDRDGTAFWGDPALDARLEEGRTARPARLTVKRDGEYIVLELEALEDMSAAEDKVEDVHVVHPFGVLLPRAAAPYACESPERMSVVAGDDFALVTSWPDMKKGESICARLRVPGDMEVSPEVRASVPDAALARDVDFLTRWTPPQYLPVPAAYVTNNCILAEAARASAPETYPDEIFLDYVLPYSVIREDRDDWRAEFRERFAQIVAGMTNAYDAAVALDRKIWDIIDVHYNVGRDRARQSPRHSMRLHMASCTGISIILIDTCRALGIPARLVGCNWTPIAGNHSWVEVWSRGGWHVLASGEKEREDDIWFLEYAEKADASRADRRIYASRWSPSPEGTLFWQTWLRPQGVSDVPADDVTADYAPGGRASRTRGRVE